MRSSLSAHAKENYRPDIDGLRAFAVLSVVLAHTVPTKVRGGFVGVDVFFVISGFLISSILLRELAEQRFSLANFYGRRVRRIFPALAVCLAAVLAYGFVVLLPSELQQLGKYTFFGAAFLSNIAIWSETDVTNMSNLLVHLWSLGIEEQFYIVWPALLWIIFRMKAVGSLLAVLFVASFAVNIWLSAASPGSGLFLPISRFWELLAGAGLAYRNQIALPPALRSWISIGGLAALLTSVMLFTPELRFPGWFALLPVAGTVAIILAGPEATVNRTILSNRVVVFVGLISYPLYLWHWPILNYASMIRLKPPTPLMAAGLIAISSLLAWATYRFIECPVRFGTGRRLRTQIAVASMTVIGAAGLATWTADGFPQRLPAVPGLDVRKIGEARRDAAIQPTRGMDVIIRDETLIAHLGKGDRKVAFSGDQSVLQYGPRVQQLADEGQLVANTYFITSAICAPVPGLRRSPAHCANMPDILLDLVQREKIKVVVLSAFWVWYDDDRQDVQIERDGKRLSLAGQDGRDAFYANLEDYVRLLKEQGARVYLVLGVPVDRVRFNPRALVVRSLTGFEVAPGIGADVPVAELRANHAFADDKLRSVADRTGALLLDVFPDVCGSEDRCSPFFAASEPKYSDGVHLRPTFVRDQIHFLDFLLK